MLNKFCANLIFFILDKDPAVYPEYYRKFKGATDGQGGKSRGQRVKGSNKATNSPFDIGVIEEIKSDNNNSKVKITMRCLLRPEQVHTFIHKQRWLIIRKFFVLVSNLKNR